LLPLITKTPAFGAGIFGTHTNRAGGWAKRSASFGPATILNLYKIAHSEIDGHFGDLTGNATVVIIGQGTQGMGVARLTDLPPEWSRQREMLGFPSH
jgi:hypothetical protein